jgi:hypothetical protein
VGVRVDRCLSAQPACGSIRPDCLHHDVTRFGFDGLVTCFRYVWDVAEAMYVGSLRFLHFLTVEHDPTCNTYCRLPVLTAEI